MPSGHLRGLHRLLHLDIRLPHVLESTSTTTRARADIVVIQANKHVLELG